MTVTVYSSNLENLSLSITGDIHRDEREGAVLPYSTDREVAGSMGKLICYCVLHICSPSTWAARAGGLA